MREQVTLLRPQAHPSGEHGVSSAFPPDVLEQVRGRVRLLSGLLLVAFAFDLVVYAGNWIVILAGYPPARGFLETGPFQVVNVVAVAASAGLWWVARSHRVSATRLHTLGLAYEIVICFIIATITFWQYYALNRLLPNLTWVPVVIVLFPLIMPGPPRRMLAAAVAAGATAPAALLVLDAAGLVTTTADAYVQVTVHSALAIAFAHMGAKLVYGLGRAVTAAQEFGSYHLVERLGEGGMGEVWRARHRLLARDAAIKVVRTSSATDARSVISEDARQRFEREAQATALLRSPHTVELFDFGVSTDGAFYYVMELLEGLDADSLVRRFGPLPAERAIYLLRQVCHSLSEAESRGLVHCDVKPANIFVCQYGEDHDFVKVLDFGIAKAIGVRADAEPDVTQANVVHGTPAFMAPEQAVDRSKVDGRADIYATGCVAYWLLTGELVFTGDTAMATLLHHAHTAPTAPSSRTDLPIPEALDRIVLSCLAKDPADRPQSARELSARLAAVDSASVWTEQRSGDWWTTHQPARRRA